jgi:hypothetical protein
MIMQLFRRQSSNGFRVRSADRDRDTDANTVGAVGQAIDKALNSLQAEFNGLTRRLTDARERASLAVGNDHDEYLTREPAKLIGLRKYEVQMRQASERLKILEEHIGHLKFLHATFYTRFSEMKRMHADRR